MGDWIDDGVDGREDSSRAESEDDFSSSFAHGSAPATAAGLMVLLTSIWTHQELIMRTMQVC